MKEKKQSKKLTIVGFKDDKDILWKKIKCKCAQDPNDVEHRYPIQACKHCKYQQCEDSVPREPFEVMSQKFNSKGNRTGEPFKVLVTKITIDRGTDDDIRGYYFEH